MNTSLTAAQKKLVQHLVAELATSRFDLIECHAFKRSTLDACIARGLVRAGGMGEGCTATDAGYAAVGAVRVEL